MILHKITYSIIVIILLMMNDGITPLLAQTVTDIDGNVYNTVTIGTQVWMAENLKTTKYRNGEAIPHITDNTTWYNLTTGAYYNYNNNTSYGAVYGKLYNWFAVTDSRNIAPTGWHVPTDAEWTTLTTYLGGESVAGGKLKEAGTSHWASPNTGATNETGFTALPCGYRLDTTGTVADTSHLSNFWSSSENIGSYNAAWFKSITYNTGALIRSYSDKRSGYTVRCVRDLLATVPPGAFYITNTNTNLIRLDNGNFAAIWTAAANTNLSDDGISYQLKITDINDNLIQTFNTGSSISKTFTSSELSSFLNLGYYHYNRTVKWYVVATNKWGLTTQSSNTVTTIFELNKKPETFALTATGLPNNTKLVNSTATPLTLGWNTPIDSNGATDFANNSIVTSFGSSYLLDSLSYKLVLTKVSDFPAGTGYAGSTWEKVSTLGNYSTLSVPELNTLLGSADTVSYTWMVFVKDRNAAQWSATDFVTSSNTLPLKLTKIDTLSKIMVGSSQNSTNTLYSFPVTDSISFTLNAYDGDMNLIRGFNNFGVNLKLIAEGAKTSIYPDQKVTLVNLSAGKVLVGDITTGYTLPSTAFVNGVSTISYRNTKAGDTVQIAVPDANPSLRNRVITNNNSSLLYISGDKTRKYLTYIPATNIYSISGTITGITNATVTLSGTGTGTTITDGSGNYSFTSLVNGSYTITPSKSGYTFLPVNISVTINGANQISQNFTATSVVIAPTVTTNSATNITTSSASINGVVNANGVSTTVTFEYGLTTSYGTSVNATPNTVTGSSNTIVSTNLSSLQQNTTYHYRVKAVNIAGTAYGSDQTFTTTTVVIAATATTTAATNVTTSAASLNGIVNANGVSTTVTFEYGLTTSYGTSLNATPNTVTGSTNTNVTASLSSLQQNTTYHYRVKAVNSGGTSYGIDQTFITGTILPTAATNSATNITATSATLNGIVNANGVSTTVTFEYGTTTGYGTSVNATPNTVTGSSNTIVSTSLSSLQQNTTYHYRIKAVNTAGTAYGGDQTFTTTTGVIAATATTTSATNVTSSGATLNGIVNANGVSTTVTFEYGLTTSYGTSVNATPNTVTGSSNTIVITSLSSLQQNTTYHYRVKAVSSGGTSYGTDQTFTTYPTAILPTVTTNSASSVLPTSAKINGWVNANGFPTTTWFEWGTNSSLASYTVASYQSIGGNSDVPISADLINLSPETVYYFRIVAQNDGGTSRGAILSFITGSSIITPTATTNPATSITANSVKLNGTANPNGISTTVWFEWSKSSTLSNLSGTSGLLIGAGNGDIPVSIDLSGLTYNTTYYYRLAAQNNNGTSRGTIQTFTTNTIPPSVTTNSANLIASTSARLNGIVNPNGLPTLIWYEWGSGSDLLSYSVTPTQSIEAGDVYLSVSADLSNLTQNHTYYYRIAGQNDAGTQRGIILAFSTNANAPLATTNIASNVSSSGVVLNGTVNANGVSTTITFEYGTTPSYGTSVNATPNTLTGLTNTNVTASLSSLQQNTSYHYCVKAISSSGTTYGANQTFTTLAITPSVSTSSASLITTTTTTLNGNINPNGIATTGWFEYSTDQNLSSYSNTSNQSIGSGASSINISSNLTGLNPNTTYYYRAAGQNSNGIYRGAIQSFKTEILHPIATTDKTNSLTKNSVGLQGSVNPNGMTASAWFEWGTDNTLVSCYKTTVNNIGSGTSDVPLAENISSLVPDKKYYYRIVIQNSYETIKGEIKNFVTYPDVLMASLMVDFPTYADRSAYKETDWKIIGLPGNSDFKLTDVMIGTEGEDWEAYDIQAGSNYWKYDGSSNFKFTTGKAFMVIRKGAINFQRNIYAPAIDIYGFTSIPLHQGWNIITNPFMFSIDWSTVQANNGNITKSIYAFNSGFQKTTTFSPHTGYLFYNDNLTALKIFYLSNNASYKTYENPNGWIVDIEYQNGDYKDASLSFGVSSDAVDNISTEDCEKPPSFSKKSEIYFSDHSSENIMLKIANHIQKNDAKTKRWDLYINSGLSENIKLKFNNTSSVPSNLDLFLIDTKTGKKYDLRKDSVVNFCSISTISIFKILAGKKEEIQNNEIDFDSKESYILLQNYPNPFNPTTIIPVTLSKNSNVIIGIFDVLGKEIKNIHSGYLSSGTHFFSWNGKDNNSNIVPSGIYFYQLKTLDGFVDSKKMMLMK
jgi:uncharacterized protein (TIGR02145 family)